jgi:RNA polymerase sigma factor (sigma-70 family)
MKGGQLCGAGSSHRRKGAWRPVAVACKLENGLARSNADRRSGMFIGDRRKMNAGQVDLVGAFFDRGHWSDASGQEAHGSLCRHSESGDRVSGGDERARFASVVLPYLDDAYALAQTLTRNSTDAEDVVQDACLRAFRGISGFADGNARTWILTIVRHSAYNWLRKNRATALVLVDDIEAVEGAQGAVADMGARTPEAALIAKTDAACLQAAIATIPAPFRETLMLREIQGLDYREIAEVTEVPIGTVMSRLARARRRLIAAVGRKVS